MKKILFFFVVLIPMITKSQSFTFKPLVDQNISCYGNNDGSVQLDAEPASNYKYTISRLTFKDSNSSGIFRNLKPGVYKVCATNNKITQCSKLTITEPKKLSIKFAVDKYPTTKDPMGTVVIDVLGGVSVLQPILTTWINSKGVQMNDVNNNFATYMENMPADTYTVKLEDDNGCFLTKSFKLIKKK
jgi:Zn-dependent M28 family amino/carboxypeptidase